MLKLHFIFRLQVRSGMGSGSEDSRQRSHHDGGDSRQLGRRHCRRQEQAHADDHQLLPGEPGDQRLDGDALVYLGPHGG